MLTGAPSSKIIYLKLKKLGIRKGDTVYLSGNLGTFGFIISKKFKKNFYDALIKSVGHNGTVVFPTHSFSLLNKNKIFCLEKTKSESGIFTEYLRKKRGVIRQQHPYSSVSALGKHKKFICMKNSKHVYGPSSPFERMIKLNAKFFSFGLMPNVNCSQVHHAEYMMNVPYRQIMQYKQKIKINNKIKVDQFYLFNLKRKFKNIKRKRNKKIFRNFKKKYNIKSTNFAMGDFYLYSLKDFYLENLKLLKRDIYCWLK